MQTSHVATKTAYQGSNKLLLGIVLAVLTFWLFAGSLVNVVPAMHRDPRISAGAIGVAISLTALFSGIIRGRARQRHPLTQPLARRWRQVG